MSKDAATKLTKRYPAAYIREKLAMAQGLVTAGSELVSKNQAGWLRRAIEEDYQPGRIPKRQQQPRAARKQQQLVRPQTESKAEKDSLPENAAQQHIPTERQTFPTEEPEPAQTVPAEKRKEHAATWEKVVEQIKKDLPAFDAGETAARLAGMTLIEVTETAARIFVPNRTAVAWLERRLYSQIAKAIKAVVGKEVDLQFIAAS
jgi:hypothetical protein